MRDIIITHAKDVDGVSPVILLKLLGRDISFYLLEIKELEEKLPVILGDVDEDVENIYITDLCPSQENYEWIDKQSWKNKLRVFDHHISHDYAKTFPFVTLDYQECATSLFYQYLKEKYPSFEKLVISEYVEHVLNLDMWYWVKKHDILAKQLGDLFEVLGNFGYIEHFTKKLQSSDTFQLDSFEKDILKIEEERIQRYFERKKEELMVFQYGQYKVGVVFAERYRSELGMALQNERPDLSFIAMINMAGGVSLRSQRDDIDLAQVASILGGGGHPKASGFPVCDSHKIETVQRLFPGAVLEEDSSVQNYV